MAGLSIGGIAHLHPALITQALTAVITLVAREILHEPPPAIEPLENAGFVHAAIANRAAPAKTAPAISH